MDVEAAAGTGTRSPPGFKAILSQAGAEGEKKTVGFRNCCACGFGEELLEAAALLVDGMATGEVEEELVVAVEVVMEVLVEEVEEVGGVDLVNFRVGAVAFVAATADFNRPPAPVRAAWEGRGEEREEEEEEETRRCWE